MVAEILLVVAEVLRRWREMVVVVLGILVILLIAVANFHVDFFMRACSWLRVVSVVWRWAPPLMSHLVHLQERLGKIFEVVKRAGAAGFLLRVGGIGVLLVVVGILPLLVVLR